MENIKGSLKRYVDNRIHPGGFLEAVLKNDLFGAFGRADSENLLKMHEIVKYIYNNIPSGSYGSPERFNEWLSGK